MTAALAASLSLFLLWSSRGALLERLLLGVSVFVATVYGVEQAGGVIGQGAGLALLALALPVGWWLRHRAPAAVAPATGAPIGDWRVGYGVALLVFIAYAVMMAKTAVLPSHDPIAVPAFGLAIVAHGTAFHQSFAPDGLFVAYPPGYPVLYAAVFGGVAPLAGLIGFKYLSIAVIALMPLAWAMALKRLFALPYGQGTLAILAYVVFFGIERSLGLAPIFAGKNAMLLAGLLFPAVLAVLVERPAGWLERGVAVAAVLGLFLVHYSTIYMLAVTCAGLLLARHAVPRRDNLAVWLQVGAVCGVALLSFVPMILMVKANNATLPNDVPAVLALADMGGHLVALKSHVLFLFHDLPWLLPSPLRGPLLLLCLGLALVAQRRGDVPGIGALAGAFAIAVLLGLVLASGLIPRLGINSDYVRWFLFFLEAPLLLAGLLVLWQWSGITGFAWVQWRRPLPLVMAAVLGVAGLSGAIDFWQGRRHVRGQAVSTATLSEMAGLLRPPPGDGPCFLVTEGLANGPQTSQLWRPLDYAPVLSACTVLTGSWIARPVAGGRDVDGLPALAALPEHGLVLFIGAPAALERYRAATGVSATPRPGPDGLAVVRLSAAAAHVRNQP